MVDGGCVGVEGGQSWSSLQFDGLKYHACIKCGLYRAVLQNILRIVGNRRNSTATDVQ